MHIFDLGYERALHMNDAVLPELIFQLLLVARAAEMGLEPVMDVNDLPEPEPVAKRPATTPPQERSKRPRRPRKPA